MMLTAALLWLKRQTFVIKTSNLITSESTGYLDGKKENHQGSMLSTIDFLPEFMGLDCLVKK
jgi:hypothetical protein